MLSTSWIAKQEAEISFPQSQIHKNTRRYLPILCYTNVLLTAQVYIAHKTFEGRTESIPCGLIPQNQYWANKFILLSLISRPFRQEEFYGLCFFQVKMLVLVVLPRSAFSATSEILQWLSEPLRAFTDGPLHLIYSFHITNLENWSQISPLVSLITSTLQKHCCCPILLTSYSFDLREAWNCILRGQPWWSSYNNFTLLFLFSLWTKVLIPTNM